MFFKYFKNVPLIYTVFCSNKTTLRTLCTLYARPYLGHLQHIALIFARSNAPVRTLIPLAICYLLWYTLYMSCKVRPLGSAAVTSGTKPSSSFSFDTLRNAYFKPFSGIARLPIYWNFILFYLFPNTIKEHH